MDNNTLIEKTIDITIAALANSNIQLTGATGQGVADFMYRIHKQLVALDNCDNNAKA